MVRRFSLRKLGCRFREGSEATLFFPLRLLVPFVLLVLWGCFGPYVHRHVVFKPASPYRGDVELRASSRRSTGQVLFRTEVFVPDPEAFVRGDEFMRLMRRRAARLGANVLVVHCEDRKPTGVVKCVLTGYRE